MLPLLLGLAAAAAPGSPLDHAEVEIRAKVAPGLDTVEVRTRTRYVPAVDLREVTVVLAADRYAAPPEPLPPGSEPQLFPGGFDPGGFSEVRVFVAGRVCRPREERLEGGERLLHCPHAAPAGALVEVEASATLQVPERYGPFGRRRRQLTLGGGWYPFVARLDATPPRGPHQVFLEHPTGAAAVIGDRYFAPVPGRTRLEHREEEASQLPLVLLPPSTGLRRGPGSRVLFVSARARARGDAERDRRVEQILLGLEDGARFLEAEGSPGPTARAPLVVVEAPLRRELARATGGALLVSDRAFRLTPVDRFYRFHRFPLLREAFTTLLLRSLSKRDPLLHPAADAAAAQLLDRYVAERFGRAEDAFDVLGLWSFIPAVDSILYAPQIPFVSAYFRLIREDDPLRANLIDFPLRLPRGKVVYEKLLDRVGPAATDAALRRLRAGSDLSAAVAGALGDEARPFLATWLGPYPEVQYRLVSSHSRPVDLARCGAGAGACFEAEVLLERTGAEVAEPLQVRLLDADDRMRLVWAAPSPDPQRVLTATVGAPLALVELDPHGRLAETPSVEVPSPRFDNRSSPRWRVLLNNFNLLLSPTAGQVDTAVDLGFSRVRDVRWRHAVRASYNLDAVGLSARTAYFFGDAVTPDRLSHWVGVTGAGEYLRPEFAGAEEGAYAVSGALYYGFDDRPTAWLPDAGTGLRLSLNYNRVLGDLSAAGEGVTRDAVALTARALRSWRAGAHQFSIRGTAGAYLAGHPRPQLLYAIGGRNNVRGYRVDAQVGRYRAVGSAEWVHPIFPELNENAADLVWATGLDGAFFADVAVISDDLGALRRGPVLADVGYGFRLYLDYFGVRPGVMAVDIAFPLVELDGRVRVGPPAVYIDFGQSFLVF